MNKYRLAVIAGLLLAGCGGGSGGGGGGSGTTVGTGDGGGTGPGGVTMSTDLIQQVKIDIAIPDAVATAALPDSIDAIINNSSDDTEPLSL